MIGPLYAERLGRLGGVGNTGAPDDRYDDLVLEGTDAQVTVLPVAGWDAGLPGDESLLQRCRGPVLDAGSGPVRLAAALAGRGVPVLGVDITSQAVPMARLPPGFRGLTGYTTEPYLERWLLVTGVLFLLSALAYAARLRRASRRPRRTD
ncbi:MAG: hypothetical protein GEV03_17685 [Streptosporangiales bacterium]|nr:hypothetical protein [Streptosporangiales bacterium]